MAHSLEVRPPFLDHRVVEFAATLPDNLKIRGSKLKFVLRELMKDKLPRSVLTRKKEGFDIPVHHWLRTPSCGPLLLDTLNERTIRETGDFFVGGGGSDDSGAHGKKGESRGITYGVCWCCFCG